MSEPRLDPDVPQRTMLVLADSFPNVSETFIDDHIRSMVESGWKVTLLVRQLNAGFDSAATDVGTGAAIHKSPAAGIGCYFRALLWITQRPWSWANSFAWRCALHGARLAITPAALQKWDIVHAHYGNNGVSALIARPEWRKQLIVNFHGYDATSMPKRHGWTTYRRMLSQQHAIAHSSFVEELLNTSTNLCVHRVTMGVDLARFKVATKPLYWPHTLHLLCVGRLSPQKGQSIAIDALQRLRERRPDLDAYLTIIGDGSDRSRLQAQVEDLALSDRVDFLGPRPYEDMPALYSSSHILLVPSQNTRDGQQEAFSRVTLEAMACGVPVVGSPSGGLPETIGSGGVVMDSFEDMAVANAIASLLERNDPSAWAGLARARAECFSIQQMAAEYLVLYDLITGEAGEAHAE